MMLPDQKLLQTVLLSVEFIFITTTSLNLFCYCTASCGTKKHCLLAHLPGGINALYIFSNGDLIKGTVLISMDWSMLKMP